MLLTPGAAYSFSRREAAQLAKMLSDEALKMIDADLKAEMPDDTNDAKLHSLEEKKKIEKEHPGKWIVYVNGDTNPELEFATQDEAMKAAKNEWEASLLGDVNVSVAWSADDDDPRFGDVSFTPFYELGRIDNFGRWRTAWDRVSSNAEKYLKLVKSQSSSDEYYSHRNTIKKGDLIEFTRDYRRDYTMGTGEYGIAIEDERPDNSVMVELADGTNYLAKYIHAFTWMGWVPEELEEIQMKHRSEYDDDYGDIF